MTLTLTLMYITFYLNFVGVYLGLMCLYMDLDSKVKSPSYLHKDFNKSHIIDFFEINLYNASNSFIELIFNHLILSR